MPVYKYLIILEGVIGVAGMIWAYRKMEDRWGIFAYSAMLMCPIMITMIFHPIIKWMIKILNIVI